MATTKELLRRAYELLVRLVRDELTDSLVRDEIEDLACDIAEHEQGADDIEQN